MTPKRRALITALKTVDLAVVTASFILAIALTADDTGPRSWVQVLEMRVRIQNALFVGAYLAMWHFVLKGLGLYESYRLSPAFREWRDLASAVLIGIAPLVPLHLLFDFQYVSAPFLLAFAGLALTTLGAERRLFRALARRLRVYGRNLRNVVVIGDGDVAYETSSTLVKQNDLGYCVIDVIEAGSVSDVGEMETQRVTKRLASRIEERAVDEVLVTLSLDRSHALIQAVISLCEEQGIMVRVAARVADLSWGRAIMDEVAGRPMLTIFSGPPETLRLIAKRAIDLVGAAISLLILAPVLAAVAVAIKLDSRGPVFFAQERVGYNRRHFWAYKFRTMVDGAERMQPSLEPLNEAKGPIFKIRDDPRITRVGKWLRRLSLDELPQLFNVLKGEMSLVGPRPLPLRDVSRIDVRWHKRRFSVKPGVTCLWQANGREPNFDEWIKADMEYIDNWSLVLDLKILLKTIPAVLSGQGAH